jgi:hypothetical protein
MKTKEKPTTISEMASLGGHARAKKLSKARRIAIARKAGKTKKKRKIL